MLNVPDSIKRLYQTDGINKNFRVHFPNGENVDLTNKDIVEGSVKFTESVSSKDVLKFGLSEQSKIEFECVGVQNIFGMTIECSNEIDTSSLTAEEIQTIQEGEWDGTLVLAGDSDIDYGYFRIPLGTFVVSSCPRSHGAMAHRRVVGYSNLFGEEYEQYRTLFDGQYPYKYLNINMYLLLFLIGSAEMTRYENEITKVEDFIVNSSFYNASGNIVNISFSTDDAFYHSETPIVGCDIIDFDYTGDLEAYEANGMAIVKALNDAKVDILYDSKKNKLYSTTEEALRAQMPYLFYPCMDNTSVLVKEGSADIAGHIDNNVRLAKGYTPVICYGRNDYQYGDDKRGYYGKEKTLKTYTEFIDNYEFSAFSATSPYVIVWENGKAQRSLWYERVPYEFEVKKLDSLQIPDGNKMPIEFKINSSLSVNGFWYERYNNKTGAFVKGARYKKNVFQNAISVPELVKSFLEINAQFGRIGRTGGQIKSLSKRNPVTLEPSDVEDLWWDEYDVEQIGTVRYNIAETQSIVEYQISDGGSVYDFGDNYFIKRIFANFTEDKYSDAISLINGLIDQYFTPNIKDVPFIPVELSMRGLPYVESGDYLIYRDSEVAPLSVSGSSIYLNNKWDNVVLTSVLCDYAYKQDLSYGTPYDAGESPNMLPYPYAQSVYNDGDMTMTNAGEHEGTFTMSGSVTFSGTYSYDALLTDEPITLESGQKYALWLDKDSYLMYIAFLTLLDENMNVYESCGASGWSDFTAEETIRVYPAISFRIQSSTESTTVKFNSEEMTPMVLKWENSETRPEGYYRYANICPIIGLDTLSVSQRSSDATTITSINVAQTLGTALYGGSVDAVTGTITKTKGYIASYNGEEIPDGWISDRDYQREIGQRPKNGAEVVYDCSPEVYTAPTTFELNDGGITITSNADSMTVKGTQQAVVDTYALSRELNGVQTLYDDIESNGGEVLGN